ncbi:MAG: PHP domain-containing protein, partial [Pseudomonadota bacterium]|nr:PHP domain-containing protein [Pseudomonadota bacterium]
MDSDYAELFCFSNFTFLTGASHPHELAEQAAELGYRAIAITDACSVAGIPRAWAALKDSPVKLITGSWFELSDTPEGATAPPRFILLARTREGYGQLCQLITTGRRRAEKGQYRLFTRDIETHSLDHCLCLWLPPLVSQTNAHQALITGEWLQRIFEHRLRLAATRTLEAGEEQQLVRVRWLAEQMRCAVVATGQVHMHRRERQPLQDVLTALRHHTTLEQAGHCLFQNAERYLRPIPVIRRLFPEPWVRETVAIAEACSFEPGSLRYEYPPDLVPEHETPTSFLARLTREGERRRYPSGTPMKVQALIRKELELIAELRYEHYFLTIHDIVDFARRQGILCQGRGSAAYSAVCYCLGIT